MALANYADLQTSVANWLHRRDMAAQIPDIIAMAEFWLARDLRISPLISTGTVTIGTAGSFGALPADFQEIVSVRSATGREVTYIMPDTYDRAIGNSNSVGVPLYYTIIGSNLYVAPVWVDGGALPVSYFAKQPALSGGSPVNWYITNCPDLLLYACLLIASPYLTDANAAAMWKEFYANGVKSLNDQYGVLDNYQRMVALNNGAGKALQPSL